MDYRRPGPFGRPSPPTRKLMSRGNGFVVKSLEGSLLRRATVQSKSEDYMPPPTNGRRDL
jgi:hypothetical protein